MECRICGTAALRTSGKAYHHGWTGLEDIRKNARKPTLFFRTTMELGQVVCSPHLLPNNAIGPSYSAPFPHIMPSVPPIAPNNAMLSTSS